MNHSLFAGHLPLEELTKTEGKENTSEIRYSKNCYGVKGFSTGFKQ